MKINVGDVIEVYMKLRLDIPEEDLSKNSINQSDYKQEYEISYFNNNSDAVCNVDFTFDAGFSPCFSDIREYLKESLSDDIPEIDKFDILEASVDDPDDQRAVIKVVSVK